MSNAKQKILFITGTRPEAIKIAPVILKLRESENLEPVLLHTGQHDAIAIDAYKFFGITPDYQIDLQRKSNTLAHLTAILVEPIFEIIQKVAPSMVVVHGDTTTTKVAALAAFYAQVPVAHVEAGLRTYEKYSPFPEEMNRTIVAKIADLHFSPTVNSEAALHKEGVDQKNVFVTGNTAVDAALIASALTKGKSIKTIHAGLADLDEQNSKVVLVTAHRRENWGEGIKNIAQAVCELAKKHPDLEFVWPVHPNPSVKEVAVTTRQEMGSPKNVRLIDPLDYSDLVHVLSTSFISLTDSGGIQEEAAALKAPVYVLRDSTERPELIEAGAGVLVGANKDVIVEKVEYALSNPVILENMKAAKNPFGDGTASEQILKHIQTYLGLN